MIEIEIHFKGINLGKYALIKKNEKNVKIIIEAEEVWNLFIRALEEDKIKLTKGD